MVQVVAPAGRQRVGVGHAREEVVIGMPDHVQHQAEHRHRRQRPEIEVVHQHGQQDDVAQHQRLQRVEAVGRPGRGHIGAVVVPMEADQGLGVQQPVVQPEVHIVPDHQHHDLGRHPGGAGRGGQLGPAQLQQAPGHDHAGAEEQHRQRRLAPFALQLVGLQGPRVQHLAHLAARQHAGQGRHAPAAQQVQRAKEGQAHGHDLPGRELGEPQTGVHAPSPQPWQVAVSGVSRRSSLGSMRRMITEGLRRPAR